MKTVLFLTHPQEECGVHQFGKLVFSGLVASRKYTFKYCVVSSPEDVQTAVGEAGAHAVLVNWHPSTMRWAPQDLFWRLGVPTIGIMHEMTEELGNKSDDVQFDYYITHDPSAHFTNPIYFSSARPIPAFDKQIAPPERLTIGTFGFATPGKGFPGLVARINAEFDDCLIRINMPNSFFSDPDGALARAVAERCRKAITKPKIDLVVSHDFMTIDGTIEFLAGNSLNAFFYRNQHGRGISSAVDLAIAAGRPIALRRVPMFRHMFDADPGMFAEQRSLKEILADGAGAVAALRAKWSLGQIGKDYEAMLDKVLPDWSSAEPLRIRRQWIGRVSFVAGEASQKAAGERAQAAAQIGTLTSRLMAAENVAALQSVQSQNLALALDQAKKDAAIQSAQKTNIEAQLSRVRAELDRVEADPLSMITRNVRDVLDAAHSLLASSFGDSSRLRRRILRRYRKHIMMPRPWGTDAQPPSKFKAVGKQLRESLPFLRKRRTKPLSRKKAIRAGLNAVSAALSNPRLVFEPSQRAALMAAIDAMDRHSELNLTRDRQLVTVRPALLEAEFVSYLNTRGAAKGARVSVSRAGRYRTVVDARCLQDPDYIGRGVGAHAAATLRALHSNKAPGERIVLLLDPMPRDTGADLSQYSDEVVYAAATMDMGTIAKFVSLSPMTASIAPVVPYLLDPAIHKIAVVYDFIPWRFPRFYLVDPAIRIAYQARLCALQCYDSFLPISKATAVELRQLFPAIRWTSIHATGVSNPLEQMPATPTDLEEPIVLPPDYILAPSGGDPRKNLLAVVAAEGIRRALGQAAKSIVVVGRMSQDHRTGAMKVANAIGIAREEVLFLQNVSRAQLAELHRQASVCVVPSHAEGFSIPVVEAVSCGAPVVASDIPAHRELLGRGWWLADSRNPSAFARAIERAARSRTLINAKQRKRIGDIADEAAVNRRLIKGLSRRHVEERQEPVGSAGAKPRRPRIAVATPWPPQRSGIADHSLRVLRLLAKHADVTALINCPDQVKDPLIKTRQISAAAYVDSDYDHVISVLGNSHFHLPIVEYLTALGGPVIAHDTRMVEFYLYMGGPHWLARLMSTKQLTVPAEKIADYFEDLNLLPNLAYWIIANVAMPMVVHSRQIAARIAVETGVTPVTLPFAPYNLPEAEDMGPAQRRSARERFGFDDDVIHIGTFGYVDTRTKGADVLIESIAWLVQWGQKVKLHIVGGQAPGLQQKLEGMAHACGVGSSVAFYDHVTAQEYRSLLLAVDVAVQIRTSPMANLSGALMDCIAHGVTTVATRSMKEEIAAPHYVFALPDKFSPLQIAEALLSANDWRRGAEGTICDSRRNYLEARSMEKYAEALLKSLEDGVIGAHG